MVAQTEKKYSEKRKRGTDRMSETTNEKLMKNKGLLLYAIIVTILLVAAVAYILVGMNEGEEKAKDDKQVETTKAPGIEQVGDENNEDGGDSAVKPTKEPTKEPEATKEPEYPIWVKEGERVKHMDKYEIWFSDLRVEEQTNLRGELYYKLIFNVNIKNVSGEDIKGKYVDILGKINGVYPICIKAQIYLPFAERYMSSSMSSSDFINTNGEKEVSIWKLESDVYSSWNAGDIYTAKACISLNENEFNEEWDSIRVYKYTPNGHSFDGKEEDIFAIKREDFDCLKAK